MKLTQEKLIKVLRILIGWVFFYSGFVKVLTFFTPAPDWTAASFLANQAGPFAQFFASMAGSVVVDYLNAFGQLAIGAALVLGYFVRPAAFWGIALMVLYYLAGFPPANAFLVNQHVIYVAVLLFFLRRDLKL